MLSALKFSKGEAHLGITCLTSWQVAQFRALFRKLHKEQKEGSPSIAADRRVCGRSRWARPTEENRYRRRVLLETAAWKRPRSTAGGCDESDVSTAARGPRFCLSRGS